ncbi:Hypothetical protein A7982_10804 [Minicystis rosea]|nr:Hypothetical protein A7982_10804 [Minicystis rosea]
MLLFLFLVLLILALGGGSWGYSRYGYVGFSPAGLLVVLLFVFWVTGNLHV